MGRFVNPSNGAFELAVNSEIYVDKTALLEYTNKVMNTTGQYICNSRPRRFGKSITADMLTAYYSKGCNSEGMFADFDIAKNPDYRKHLNKYDVIHFDVQWCMMDAGSPEETVDYINRNLIAELKSVYADVDLANANTVYGALSDIYAATGSKFIIIIDEWDVLIRDESANQAVQDEYINFIRGLFKGTEPSKYIQLAYLTGILPIKKIKTQSALNNFTEFTMLDAKIFAKYIGFTEEEVQKLCCEYNCDFGAVKRWYDGYLLEDYQVYNPKAVVEVLTWHKFQSYWSQTGTYDAIVPLINMDFDGLKTSIIEMLSGASVKVDVTSFQNDIVSFVNRDDVLTYLIHLGYLGYDQMNQTAFIPNEELRQELSKAVRRNQWSELLSYQLESQKLLDATLDMDDKYVADAMEKIHDRFISGIEYNDENSLSCVLTLGYLSAMQYYFKPVREMPTGRGFADYIYIPKPEYKDSYPALIVELKWNKSAKAAIEQIHEKKYPESIRDYGAEIILVGINYDKKTKKHECIIENLTGI